MGRQDTISRRGLLGVGLLTAGGLRASAGGKTGIGSESQGKAAVEEWFTNATRQGPAASPGIRLRGRKLGFRWDAASQYHEPPFPPNAPHANGYRITVWGSIDGRTRNRVVELLQIGPQEFNDREGPRNAFFFYQGSASGLTVPFPNAIVEFNNSTGEKLASNDLRVWTADSEPLNIRVPLQGFWGELIPHGTLQDSGSAVEQTRDYMRVIDVIDVTVYIDQPGRVEYYEQSWNEMRLLSVEPVEKKKQKVLRIRRGGFPRFVVLVRNNSAAKAYCEIVAVGKSQ
jgi:hypothetical protein